MSTLSIKPGITPGIKPAFDDQFDALVRTAFVPTRDAALDDAAAADADFHTAFDLDYGDRRLVPQQRTAPCETVLAPVVRRTPTRTRKVQVKRVRPATRLTRRGRVVAVLAFLGLALALMTSMGGFAVASLDGGTPESVRIVEVAPGETLYGIAGDLAEPGHVRDMVHRIQELNSLSGSTIAEGQKLAVPRG